MSRHDGQRHPTEPAGRGQAQVVSGQGQLDASPPLSATLLALLAVIVGASVANLYYAQPLLAPIAAELQMTEGSAGLVVTSTQLGYALGLCTIVPLGDVRERKSLLVGLLALSSCGLLAVALAPTATAVIVCLLAVGVTSAAAQLTVPIAASLAPETDRGRAVGVVTGGLLVGILVARTLAGGIADVGGWRWVYASAGVCSALLAGAAAWRLPRLPAPTSAIRYWGLLRSTWSLMATEPVLRARTALACLGMVSFTALWTGSGLMLAAPPMHLSPSQIGLLGLAGLAGVMTAPLAGRWIDRGHARTVTTVAAMLLLVSWAPLGAGQRSLALLVIGVVLLDLAQQVLQVGHKNAVFALRPDARSRVNTVMTVSVFLAGAVASAGCSALYAGVGWLGAVALGAGSAGCALLLWCWRRLRE